MTRYAAARVMAGFPRLPLRGSLDLTYRCNNNCRHCWLRIPPNAAERADELGLDEIRQIVDQARAMGCREWSLSGGEPMLRPDFAEVFEYVTRKAAHYSLNTNGALITPEIAQLLRRKGTKMVALYGATAEVHDHITRNPGSFEATLRGMAYLREAGAGFVVQLVPMRDNYCQWAEMQALARSLSEHHRCGASWLYLSACGDPARNAEIVRQRLDPAEIVALDPPSLAHDVPTTQQPDSDQGHTYPHTLGDDRLFASCIATRRDFYVDPYGGMTFCSFVKDPALIYDLRQGSVQEGWETFIPSLAGQVRGGAEYRENCAACELRADCRWCPVYGFLEHGRFSARVDHLCDVAREARRHKENWALNHRRYYQLAGITIQVDSDLPMTDTTFQAKFEDFRTGGPGEDTVTVRHHFSLPHLDGQALGREVYRRPPWVIYDQGGSWIYRGITPSDEDTNRLIVFSRDHTQARIYHADDEMWQKGGLHALTGLTSDQILVARLLADRQACYLHSSGVILNGQGLLFVGHSDAGKSTISRMLAGHGEVLCDDRNIVRLLAEGFRVHGTWSHGEWPVISAASAPLRALFFLEQAPENRLAPLHDRAAVVRSLLPRVIKPFVTADWWQNTLDLVEALARQVPAYRLYFDKSGGIVHLLDDLAAS